MVAITNTKSSSESGWFGVNVLTGGDINDCRYRTTPGSGALDNLLKEYVCYIDVSNNGSGTKLSSSTITQSATKVGSTVTSAGYFTGAASNIIDWVCVSEITSDYTYASNKYTFTARTGTLGTLRVLQYCDLDPESFNNDFFIIDGSYANNNLYIYCYDKYEQLGIANWGELITSDDKLKNATFVGFHLNIWNNIQLSITGAGLIVSTTGTIVNLVPYTDPIYGDGYTGSDPQNDMVDAMAYDVTPGATTATITTYLGIPMKCIVTFTKVTSGGEAETDDFTFTVDGRDVIHNGTLTLTQGSSYTVTENEVEYYEITDATGNAVFSNGVVTLSVPYSATGTCVITNTYTCPPFPELGTGSYSTTLTDAIKEAYASCDQDVLIYHTLELRHPGFIENGALTSIRVVRDVIPLEATLEANAPMYSGQTVTFQPMWFDFTLPGMSKDQEPQLQITLDGVTSEIVGYLEGAMDSTDPIEVTYRPYLNTDKTVPQMNPPLTLYIVSINCTLNRVTANATAVNLVNKAFPSMLYTTTRYPGLTV